MRNNDKRKRRKWESTKGKSDREVRERWAQNRDKQQQQQQLYGKAKKSERQHKWNAFLWRSFSFSFGFIT